ncbi:MAG: glycosyltransferase family 39 protein [Candidatus Moranbacteria bacterium]|nr:glycosyltransferase family 39 protein [Candidatus Moranbacteria bacterium]
MQNFLEKNYKIIVGLILAFMFVVSVLNAWWDSAIFDEDAHIPAGYSYLTMHDMRLNPEHPPLLKDLAAFPLLFMHLKFDTTQKFWTTDINGQWDAGHNLFWQEGNNPDQIIFWARIPIVLLSLLFGFFIFKWGKELAGILGGLFALTLYAFDPNILGHNHFVTTDLGIAGFMMISFYYFLKFIKDPTWKNVAIGGFFLAIVQLTKFSSIMLLPIFGLVAIIYPLVKKIPAEEKSAALFKLKKLGEYLGKSFIALAFSLFVVWLFYAFNNYAIPKEKLAETINFYFSATDINVKTIYTNKILIALNQTALLRPLSEYFLGIAMVFKRVSGGNGAYFMGAVSGTAFRAYFPTVFAFKEPLVMLFLMLSALLLAFWNNLKALISRFRDSAQKSPLFSAFGDYLRHHIETLAMFAFIILYAYISITGNLNIGFRHLFPILPFAYLLTAKTIIDFCQNRKNLPTKIVFLSATLILSLLLIIETVVAYPYYMSYFNQMAGGPKNGYRYATDSNADWGQDLKRLRVWINDYNSCAKILCDPNQKVGCPSNCYSIATPFPTPGKPIDKIRVDYFGGADIKYYVRDKYEIWYDSKRPLEAGWYAISTNFLEGSIYDTTKKDQDSYRWTRNIAPVYQVGTSIFIYYVSAEDLKKLN